MHIIPYVRVVILLITAAIIYIYIRELAIYWQLTAYGTGTRTHSKQTNYLEIPCTCLVVKYRAKPHLVASVHLRDNLVESVLHAVAQIKGGLAGFV